MTRPQSTVKKTARFCRLEALCSPFEGQRGVSPQGPVHLEIASSLTSPIDPLVCTLNQPSFGHCFAIIFVCADTLAYSPLLFPERFRDLPPWSPFQLTSNPARPSRRPPCINDNYHLIYALYAYRSPSRRHRRLFNAGDLLSA